MEQQRDQITGKSKQKLLVISVYIVHARSVQYVGHFESLPEPFSESAYKNLLPDKPTYTVQARLSNQHLFLLQHIFNNDLPEREQCH